MGKLAFDPEPALSILPVRHAHLFASDLSWFSVHGEGDVFLQGAESLIRLSFEGVGEHAAAGAGVQ